MADDKPHFPQNYSYGKGSHGSEHVENVMKGGMLIGMQDKFNDIKEN